MQPSPISRKAVLLARTRLAEKQIDIDALVLTDQQLAIEYVHSEIEHAMRILSQSEHPIDSISADDNTT